MKLFNTMTREKQEFIPLEPGKVKMYVCGPTVYNLVHIGNARPATVFDTLRRYFEYLGYEVEFVQNITDIDDKLIRRAAEENTTVKELSVRYADEFFKDLKGLGSKEATANPRATENIGRICDMISDLIQKGHAYVAEDGVYFRTGSFASYGKLSHQPMEELQNGASNRVGSGEHKEDPMDFALWKKSQPGEPVWEAPFGAGRPGWHIECSAMVREYLGDTIDIHAGGMDLIFPHHENEIAQSECCTGKEFARYWLHNAYLNIDNKKMSKSTGNFRTVREVADAFGYGAIRLMMLSAHYRSPLNYTEEVIRSAKSALERIENCKDRLAQAAKMLEKETGEQDSFWAEAAEKARISFEAAMDDDMNTADGLSALFDLVRQINAGLNDKSLDSLTALRGVQKIFDAMCRVFGLLQEEEKTSDGPDEAEIEALIEARRQAKKNKDFAAADGIRQQLSEMGIQIADTREGTTWKRV